MAEDYNELGSAVLRGYGKFLKSQNENFEGLIKKLDNNLLNSSKLIYPIALNIEPYENIDLLNIIQSDNRILKKVIATFSFLCGEIEKLQEEANNKFYYFIALYNINFAENKVSPEEFISSHIEELHELNAFVKRCHDVVINLTRQICGLTNGDVIDLKNFKLSHIISKLGDILMVLVTLDHLINSSQIFNHWTMYRKAIKLIHADVKKYNETSENLKSMDVILNNIEEKVLRDKIFEHCMDSLTNINVKLVNINTTFVLEEFSHYLRKSTVDLEKSTVDYYESTSSIQWTKLNGLFVFHTLVFGNPDKKILKTLIDANCKAHSVPLFGSVMWYPEQFLSRYINFLITNHSKSIQNIAKSRQAYINNKKQNILKDIYNAQIQISKWSLNMNEAFSNNDAQLNPIQMNHRSELLNQGIKYASQINFLIYCFMNLHYSQGIPITKNALSCVCKFFEILKCIEEVFQNNYFSISSTVKLIVQHITYQIVSKLFAAKKSLIADKNYSKQRLDELAALVVVERAFKGPLTPQRRIVINVALSFVPPNIINENIGSLLESIEGIVVIQNKVKTLCNCMFLCWNKLLITHYLNQIIITRKDMAKLSLFVKVFNDSFCAIKKGERIKNSEENTKRYFEEIKYLFDTFIIHQLGQDIETNLRLHTHTHLKLERMNPFEFPAEVVKPILKLKNLRFHNETVSVIHGIEHYLSYTFYNLTTVVLHDWKTYGEMRQLANIKFDIRTIEDELPAQTLEQGLDILDIMRNIHTFVSKYLYNLNNQIFIEHTNNSKSLNTINIIHIANSIRTHGTGIMNTTVNFTYQFLRKKFHNFSQFMYDEQIKSRLIKDMRHFRESSTDIEQMYSYKRADKFNKAIRNLGLDEDGRSYLDLFRILISEIGNAMGYVRMVRSGGLHCCANASAFLPSLEDVWSFDELLQDDALNEHTMQSTKNLENTINNLISNFFHGTEYFKLFVDVFSPIFRNPDNAHLKTFYVIVPPLTLNFVENILLCKDKLNKKNMLGAAFTDDGFAMGLAYILKLLDQDQGLDSLHWFESVNKHIAQERKNIQEQLAKGSSQVHQALALTQKKLNILEQEFQLLYFSFSSARIFFQV